LVNAKAWFEAQIKQKNNSAAEYGLAFVAFKQAHFKEAQTWLNKAIKASGTDAPNLFFTSLQSDILLHSQQNEAALKQAGIACNNFLVHAA